MLRQILTDMYIDPDLLAELDNEQKQILFCKMREEQLRRWKYHDDQLDKELSKKPKIPPKPGKKKVEFLLGKDGEPWTWVMGDHSDDRSIENILEDEVRRKALLQAEKEAEDIRRKNGENAKKDATNTVLHVAPVSNASNGVCLPPANGTNGCLPPTNGTNGTENNSQSSENKREDWLKKKQQALKEHRVNEIYASLRETQRKADELAEIVRKEQEELWLEREKKAKEAERQIREIARQAREEHKKVNITDQIEKCDDSKASDSIHQDTKIVPVTKHKRADAFVINNRNKTRPNKPPTKDAIMDWFQTDELPNGSGLDPSSQQLSPWFHGMIGGMEAENLLDSKSEGTFLVRLSERIWGYAISYRSKERCKHFLVEASGDHYQFFGSGHLPHESLHELIMYHMKRPITTIGQEYLLHPCDHDPDSSAFKALMKLMTKVV